MQKRRLIYNTIKRPFLKIFLTFTCSIKDALYLFEYWPKTYITVCSTLVPGPFPFPRNGKGPRNEIDSVLFRSASTAKKKCQNINCIEIMCNYLLHNFFFGKRENLGRSNDAHGRKRDIALGDKKENYATPTNEDLGQTSNWSKLVAAYLLVARLTILDRLVLNKMCCSSSN